MQRDFHGMDQVYTGGTPGDTGDAIQVLMAAGAKIWHMKNQTQSGGALYLSMVAFRAAGSRPSFSASSSMVSALMIQPFSSSTLLSSDWKL